MLAPSQARDAYVVLAAAHDSSAWKLRNAFRPSAAAAPSGCLSPHNAIHRYARGRDAEQMDDHIDDGSVHQSERNSQQPDHNLGRAEHGRDTQLQLDVAGGGEKSVIENREGQD